MDVQRELAGHVALSLGYTGTRGDDLSYGGGVPSGVRVNINQLPSAALALGPSLHDQVANPFFGISQAGELASSPTIERRQLLRPFPQFGDVFEHQTSGARMRYHAVTAMIDRRVAGGWGGRFHYTWSRRDDDQFGEGNTYSTRQSTLPVNSDDLGREYSRSIQDVPHRIVLAPIVELPFGSGRRWATDGIVDLLAGGWTVAAIARYQSGSPLAMAQVSDNSGSFSGAQRPNVTGVDPNTPGSTETRLDHYINPAAYSFAAPFTFGDAPRTDPRIRSPFQTNYDLAVSKEIRTTGRVKPQVRVEILNLTNRPLFYGPNTIFGSRAFGAITQQAGFSRLLQVTLRATW